MVGRLYFVLKDKFAQTIQESTLTNVADKIIEAIFKEDKREYLLTCANPNEGITEFKMNFGKYVKRIKNPTRLLYPLAAFFVWDNEARAIYTPSNFMSNVGRRKKQPGVSVPLTWEKEVEIAFNKVPEYKHKQEEFLQMYPTMNTTNTTMLEKYIGSCLHEKDLIKTSGGIERVNQGELFTPSHASGQWR